MVRSLALARAVPEGGHFAARPAAGDVLCFHVAMSFESGAGQIASLPAGAYAADRPFIVGLPTTVEILPQGGPDATEDGNWQEAPVRAREEFARAAEIFRDWGRWQTPATSTAWRGLP